MERRALANRKREADALAVAASMAEDGLVSAEEAAAEAEREQRPRFDIPPSLGYLYRTIGSPRKSVVPRKQLRVVGAGGEAESHSIHGYTTLTDVRFTHLLALRT